MDEQEITLAFAEMRICRKNVFDASQEVADAKVALETKKNWTINNNLGDCTNDIARKGRIAESIQEETSALDIAERKYSSAQFFFDLASYEVRRVDLLVQFISISKGE